MEVQVIVRGDFNGRSRYEWGSDPLNFIVDIENNTEIWLLRAVKDYDRIKAMMAADTHEWVELVRKENKGLKVRSSPDVKWFLKGYDRNNNQLWQAGDSMLDDPPFGVW